MKRNFSSAKPIIVIALVCALSFIISKRASAQVLGNAVGPKVGIYLDGGNFMIGGVAEFPLTANIDIEPGVELIFGRLNTTRIVLDANIRYSFLLQGLTVKPFVLGGVGLQYDSYKTTFPDQPSSRTKPLLNFGGGAAFNTRSRLQPWGALKFSILGAKGDGGAVLEGGVNFYL